MRRIALSGVGLVVTFAACNEPSGPRRQIAFAPADTTVELGETLYQRVVDASRPDSALVPGDDYVYSADDSAMLDVHSQYRGIIARKAGTTTVRAVLRADPRVTAAMVVHVRPSRVFLPNFPAGPIEVGVFFDVAPRYTGWKNNNVIVSSSDRGVVLVRQSNPQQATIVAVAPGNAVVTAVAIDDTTQRATYPITVVAATVAKIVVSPATVQLQGKNDSVRVLATLTSTAGQLFEDRSPTVLSANQNIAAIVHPVPGAPYSFYVRSGFSGNTTITLQSGSTTAVIPVNVAIAAADSAYVYAGNRTSALVTANDAASTASDALEILGIASAPKHGSATFAGATLQYSPAAGFLGADTAAYIVRDRPTGVLDTGVVRFNVIPGPYTVTDLTSSLGPVTLVDLNDRGEVLVNVTTSATTRRAARWRNGEFSLLDVPDGLSSWGVAMNDSGDVVGTAPFELFDNGAIGGGRPAIWRGGSTRVAYLFADTPVAFAKGHQQPRPDSFRGGQRQHLRERHLAPGRELRVAAQVERSWRNPRGELQFAVP